MKEGFIVAVDAYTLHYSQEHWGSVDVNEFYPLRFSPEYARNKFVYMPFGLGARLCVGKLKT
jgi:cytochrome P450